MEEDEKGHNKDRTIEPVPGLVPGGLVLYTIEPVPGLVPGRLVLYTIEPVPGLVPGGLDL